MQTRRNFIESARRSLERPSSLGDFGSSKRKRKPIRDPIQADAGTMIFQSPADAAGVDRSMRSPRVVSMTISRSAQPFGGF
jgi:hypothetical protein